MDRALSRYVTTLNIIDRRRPPKASSSCSPRTYSKHIARDARNVEYVVGILSWYSPTKQALRSPCFTVVTTTVVVLIDILYYDNPLFLRVGISAAFASFATTPNTLPDTLLERFILPSATKNCFYCYRPPPESTAQNASWLSCTRPTVFALNFPFFCFSNNFFFRLSSPPPTVFPDLVSTSFLYAEQK